MKLLTLLFLLVAATCCSAETFHCTKCKHEVLEGDAFCPNCGVKFDCIRREAPPQYVSAPVESPLQESEGERILRDYNARGYMRTKDVDERLPVPAGALRGLCTIAQSPVEIVRTAATIESSLLERDAANAFFGTIFGTPTATAIFGPFTVAGDVVVGMLDVLTLGWIGNSVWGNPRKSAWFWRRNWTGHPQWGVCNAIGW